MEKPSGPSSSDSSTPLEIMVMPASAQGLRCVIREVQACPRIFAGNVKQITFLGISIREGHAPALSRPVIIGPIGIPVLFVDGFVYHNAM